MIDLYSSAEWAVAQERAHGFEIHRTEQGNPPYVVVNDVTVHRSSEHLYSFFA